MAKTALQRLAATLLSRQADYEALQFARHSMLDTAGCILTGSSSDQVKRLELALADDGANLPVDALRNGTAAHAIDYDDYEELGTTHPSAVIVPALCALATRYKFTNTQMLNAYVSGFEAILAIGKVLGYQHYVAGWHSTSTIGRVGAAMACSKLLGLNTEQAVNAMSLAMTQSAGMKVEFGTDAKALHAGLAARTGLEVALLARSGFTASALAGDGAAGYLQMYGTSASPGWSCLFETDLPGINEHPPYLKLSPSCSYTLRAIEAAELIHAKRGFNFQAIDDFTVKIAEPYHAVAGVDLPSDSCEARFSVVFCVAAGLIDGRVGVGTFTPGAVQRDDISNLLNKTTVNAYQLAAGLGDMSPDAPDTVTVHMRDGSQFTETVACVRGGPGRLLTSEEVVEKFISCGGRADTATEFLQTDLSEPFRDPGKG